MRGLERGEVRHLSAYFRIDGLGPRVRDFLPPPERLALREAARRRVPYQHLIRTLVDEYTN